MRILHVIARMDPGGAERVLLYLAQYGADAIAFLVSLFVILVPLVMLTFTVVQLIEGYVGKLMGRLPVDDAQVGRSREALEKLQLNDSAFSFEPESSAALGFGFRCGFLGLLHMEIVQERLEREYDLDLITTAPTVTMSEPTSKGSRPYMPSIGYQRRLKSERMVISRKAGMPSRNRKRKIRPIMTIVETPAILIRLSMKNSPHRILGGGAACGAAAWSTSLAMVICYSSGNGTKPRSATICCPSGPRIQSR